MNRQQVAASLMEAGLDEDDLELVLGPEAKRYKVTARELPKPVTDYETLANDVADCLESLVQQFQGVKGKHVNALNQLDQLAQRVRRACY